MKLNTTSTIALAALLTIAAASAQVPAILNYQGRVSIGGSNYNGTGLFKFALVNSNGTEVFWNNAGAVTTNEPANAVSLVVTQGLYSVLVGDTSLGNMATIPQTVFTNNDLRLRVWFSPGADGIFMPFSPDQRLGAAAYAMRAAAADNASPTNISGNLTVSGVLSAGQLIGGSNNTATGDNSSVTGGSLNTNAGYAAFLGGGESNSIAATASNAVIGGGSANATTTNYTTISGGQNNTASGTFATISGGVRNSASSSLATVGGGQNNSAGGSASTIAGGYNNRARGAAATVGGGNGNIADGALATVGGGFGNTARTNSSTVSGGELNGASGWWAYVGGGTYNSASGTLATIGGGYGNTASTNSATIAGGELNTASGSFATVSGGGANTATGRLATVSGGITNTASGQNAIIPGGSNNIATNNAFAAGTGAKATNNGAFVWSGVDSVETASTNSTSFTVRAPGGARFITTTNTDFSDTNIVNGVQLLPNETAWTVLSDRAAKTNFAAIDKRKVLAKLAAMPLAAWSYKHDPTRRYIGPTAQDFSGAFHLGHNDKGINTLDADGVAFAAIQGLVEELKARDARIERLEAELGEIRKQLGNLPPAP